MWTEPVLVELGGGGGVLRKSKRLQNPNRKVRLLGKKCNFPDHSSGGWVGSNKGLIGGRNAKVSAGEGGGIIESQTPQGRGGVKKTTGKRKGPKQKTK